MSAGGVGLFAVDAVDDAVDVAVDGAVSGAVSGADGTEVEGIGDDDSREHPASVSNAKENAAPERDAAK
jgi:hypothetical protein